MSKSKKKSIIIISAILVIVVLITGVFGVMVKNRKAVKVAPVASMSDGGWYSDSEIADYGTVTTNMNQDIYYDESLTVTKVYVQAGDTVEIGDPLIAYDMTLPKLELEMKQMQIEGIGLNILNVQAELAQLRATTPVASNKDAEEGAQRIQAAARTGDTLKVVRAAVYRELASWQEQGTTEASPYSAARTIAAADDGMENPTGVEKPGNPENPGEGEDPDTPEEPQKPSIGEPFPEELLDEEIHESITPDTKHYNEDGEGTLEKPYRFLCAPGVKINSAFMQKILENKLVCIFDLVDNKEKPTLILYSWMLDGHDGMVVKPVEPEKPEDPNEPEEPDSPVIEDPVVPQGPTYEELQKEIREKEQQLKDLDLDKRTAELELKTLQNKVDNGIVNSTVKGTVKSVVDEETARLGNTPMISVTGEEGFYITGRVAETALDKLEKGMTATVTSWESGMTYEASVTGVSSSPLSGNYYGNNENMSYYPFTLVIKGDAELRSGEGVNLQIDGMTSMTSDELYLSQMFVREEGNQYYVYKKGENGRLTKQYVEVGKIIYGSMEIVSGLTMEDEIAFPYGRDVKEGAKTESAESLYEYY